MEEEEQKAIKSHFHWLKKKHRFQAFVHMNVSKCHHAFSLPMTHNGVYTWIAQKPNETSAIFVSKGK